MRKKTAGHFKIQQSITYCLCVHWNQPITLSNKIYGSCRLFSINYPHGRINIVSLYTNRFTPFTVSCKSEARAGTLTLPLPHIFTHFMYTVYSHVMMKHVLSARGAIGSEARKSYTCVHCMKIDWIRNK